MEKQSDSWQSLLLGTFVPTDNPIPAPIQRAIASAARARNIPPSISQELDETMCNPFSFQEFEHCRQHLASGKSLDSSGLTTTQMKHWGPETAEMVFELS